MNYKDTSQGTCFKTLKSLTISRHFLLHLFLLLLLFLLVILFLLLLFLLLLLLLLLLPSWHYSPMRTFASFNELLPVSSVFWTLFTLLNIAQTLPMLYKNHRSISVLNKPPLIFIMKELNPGHTFTFFIYSSTVCSGFLLTLSFPECFFPARFSEESLGQEQSVDWQHKSQPTQQYAYVRYSSWFLLVYFIHFPLLPWFLFVMI